MTPFEFHRLSLNDGARWLRRFEPIPGMLAPLDGLRADGAYVRLTAPMDGYGLELTPGSGAAGGAFRSFLELGGGRRLLSACVYCAAEADAADRFDEAVEACRLAASLGRVAGVPRVLRRPPRTPWLASLKFTACGPPEAPLLEDAVFMTLADWPRPGVCSSRALQGWP